jgi:3-oxoacyl-[acyl-carrier-protein] synthase-1
MTSKRRVVITGAGILSSLGNDLGAVSTNLRAGRSGVRAYPDWAELGLPSTVGGGIDGIEELVAESGISQRRLSMMGPAALYTALAAKQAIADAGLTSNELGSGRTGCIVGSGSCCSRSIYEGANRLFAGKPRRINPYTLVRSMSSSTSANLVQMFGIGGRSYSMSSACATSGHTIGHAFELIRAGALDCAVAGGAEEVSELATGAFCAMRLALSTGYNDQPKRASRPFDSKRDGFVISGGGGIVVLEELETARARGARARAEILGFSANSDGYDMIHPEPSGWPVASCIRAALEDAGVAVAAIDYVNAHATGTIPGDVAEIRALQDVFEERPPPISSTKSMAGHALGAAGVHELMHCILMIEGGFIAPSINVDELDPKVASAPIVTAIRELELQTLLSTSLGFGGSNCVLVIQRPH